MRKQIDVVGAVVVRDGTVLAAQRGAEMVLAGLWEFPGGKIEAGETPQQSLARELCEELLCTVEVGAPVETTAHEYDFGTVTLRTFYATLIHGEPQPTEHAAVRWLPVDDLDTVIWAPADLPAVERVMAELGR